MDLGHWTKSADDRSEGPRSDPSRSTGGGPEDQLTGIWPPFAVERHDDGNGALRLRLVGELDLASGPFCEAALLEAEAEGELVLLDLRDLWFLDCTGLRVILEAEQRLRQSGRRLTVIRGPRPVQRLLELLGATARLDVLDDLTAWQPTHPPAVRVAGQGS